MLREAGQGGGAASSVMLVVEVCVTTEMLRRARRESEGSGIEVTDPLYLFFRSVSSVPFCSLLSLIGYPGNVYSLYNFLRRKRLREAKTHPRQIYVSP